MADPVYNAVDFDWSGDSVYADPVYNAVDFSWLSAQERGGGFVNSFAQSPVQPLVSPLARPLVDGAG